jgi:AsmA protein
MRRVTVIILSVVGMVVLAIVATPFLLDVNSFRPMIESELSQALGREVKIGDLKLRILKGTVTAGNLSVADDPAFSREPFLSAKSIGFVVALAPALFHHTLDVSGIDVENPQVTLIQTPNGSWNFSTMGTAKSRVRPVSTSNENLALSIKSLKVADARVSVTQGSRPLVLEHVNVEVKDFAPNVSFPFTLTGKMQGGGDIRVVGQAGPINAGNSASTPLNASLRIIKLNLTGTGVVPTSEGVDGLVSLDGTATSDGRAMHFTGKITGERMKFAPSGTPTAKPLLDVDLTSQLPDHSGQLKRGDVAIGGVKAALTGTWTEPGKEPVLRMALSAPGVPMAGVQDLLPALGIVLPSGSQFTGGTASASLNISGPTSAMVISGPVSIRDSQLKNFDLGSKMSAIQKLAGIKTGPNTQIQTLSTNLRIAPESTALQSIQLVVPSIGQLTGDGVISRSQVLDFKMRAAVAGGATTNIPFFIQGTSSDPKFRPDVAGIAQEELNQRLKGVKVGGANVGQNSGGLLNGIFGKKKK